MVRLCGVGLRRLTPNRAPSIYITLITLLSLLNPTIALAHGKDFERTGLYITASRQKWHSCYCSNSHSVSCIFMLGVLVGWHALFSVMVIWLLLYFTLAGLAAWLAGESLDG